MVEGAGFAQRERPVVQGPGLHGKEKRKSFVERAGLLNRPLRTRMVGGVGDDGLEAVAYPIKACSPNNPAGVGDGQRPILEQARQPHGK